MVKNDREQSLSRRDVATLLNNKDERNLRIIEILTYSNDDYSVKEITKRLGISTRTLQRDIDSINEEYDYLNIVSNGVLTIQFKGNHSICNVYEDILQGQPIFNLIDKIILRDDLNITYLSAMLNVSIPTMYKNISSFNSYIKDRYDFCIETSPCQFVGDEEDIRSFLHHYLQEAHGAYAWPFDEIREYEVEKLLNTIFTKLGYSNDYSTYQNMKIIVALNILFYRRGRAIEDVSVSRVIEKFASEGLKNVEEDDSLVDFFARMGINLSLNDLLQVCYPFLSDRFLIAEPCPEIMQNLPYDTLQKLDLIKDVIEFT